MLVTVPTIPIPGGHVKEKLTPGGTTKKHTPEMKIAFPFFKKKPISLLFLSLLPNHSGVLSVRVCSDKRPPMLSVPLRKECLSFWPGRWG